jgi:hypothetical protein
MASEPGRITRIPDAFLSSVPLSSIKSSFCTQYRSMAFQDGADQVCREGAKENRLAETPRRNCTLQSHQKRLSNRKPKNRKGLTGENEAIQNLRRCREALALPVVVPPILDANQGKKKVGSGAEL